MGSPLSPVIANFYMEGFEEEALDTAVDRPSLWVRYVNETFVIWPHGPDKLENFHSHLNSLRKSIQFTIEREQSNQLLFLDVLVTPHPSIGKQHTQISIYTMSPITIQESRVGS